MGRFSEACARLRKGLALLEGWRVRKPPAGAPKLSAWYAACASPGPSFGSRSRGANARSPKPRVVESGRRSPRSFHPRLACFSIGRFDLATHSERALEIYELGLPHSEAAFAPEPGRFSLLTKALGHAVALFRTFPLTRCQPPATTSMPAMGSVQHRQVLTDQGRYTSRAHSRPLIVCRRGADYRSGVACAKQPARSDRGADRAERIRARHFDIARRESSPRLDAMRSIRHASRRMPVLGGRSRRGARCSPTPAPRASTSDDETRSRPRPFGTSGLRLPSTRRPPARLRLVHREPRAGGPARPDF